MNSHPQRTACAPTLASLSAAPGRPPAGRRCTALALLGWLALPLGAQEPGQPGTGLAPLLQTDGSASPAWRFVGFPKSHTVIPPTLFEAGAADGVRAVRVSTDASYGTLVHDWNGPAGARLQWRWRLDVPLAGGRSAPDILSKAGDDAALKVCVMFDHPLQQVPFVERTVLRLARRVSGEPLPAATLCYLWDSSYPAGLQGANPYTRRVRFITLQGRSAPLQRWVSESRDPAQDYIDLFADELPAGRQTPRSEVPHIRSVLLGADSDNTATKSTGWVSELRWAAGSPP